MKNLKHLEITFDTATPGEAAKLAEDLQYYLIRTKDASVSIQKDNSNTLEFGSTLILILGSASVIELAKGIADWMRKRDEVGITIKNNDKEVIVTNAKSKDISIVMDKFRELDNATK